MKTLPHSTCSRSIHDIFSYTRADHYKTYKLQLLAFQQRIFAEPWARQPFPQYKNNNKNLLMSSSRLPLDNMNEWTVWYSFKYLCVKWIYIVFFYNNSIQLWIIVEIRVYREEFKVYHLSLFQKSVYSPIQALFSHVLSTQQAHKSSINDDALERTMSMYSIARKIKCLIPVSWNLLLLKIFE